ncbi:ester cyclase [Paenarthrobacter sp. NEAU-H11]|uniref:ester cyclase n=1 Tax=Paenarthrobacter sp. NEAU-H11 TaxID=3423924 RepID=UPI003D331A7B
MEIIMPRKLDHIIAEMDTAWETKEGAKAVAEHFADDGVLYDMTSLAPVSGRAAIEEALAVFTRAFHPLSFESALVGDDGITAVVEWKAKGVHAGELDGIAATGRTVELHGVNLMTFSSDGKVTQERSYWDSGALLRQLGVFDS